MHATSIVNGVDLDRLSGKIDAVAANPALARFQFRARNHWIDGLLAVSASMVSFCVLLIRGRIHQPRQQLGHRLTFANGVRRMPRNDRGRAPKRYAGGGGLQIPAVVPAEPGAEGVLARKRRADHTPFLAGLPGFVSKLWLTYDEPAVYGGVYEWDGAQRAELAAQTIRWILPSVAVPSSIAYQVIPNQTRDQYLAESQAVVSARSSEPATGDA